MKRNLCGEEKQFYFIYAAVIACGQIKIYLVGTGTSVKLPIMAASLSRIKADNVFSRKSTSPTKMLLASAPGGIFFIKCIFDLCKSLPVCSSLKLVFRCIERLLGLFVISSPVSKTSTTQLVSKHFF